MFLGYWNLGQSLNLKQNLVSSLHLKLGDFRHILCLIRLQGVLAAGTSITMVYVEKDFLTKNDVL